MAELKYEVVGRCIGSDHWEIIEHILAERKQKEQEAAQHLAETVEIPQPTIINSTPTNP